MLNVKRRDKIPRSDMIAIIESINGIDSVYVKFISEDDENAINALKATSPTGVVNYQSSSIDSFGDIIIGKNQLIVLRGGWSDSDGNQYTVSPIPGSLGPLNILITSPLVPVNFNNQLNRTTRDSIMSKM